MGGRRTGLFDDPLAEEVRREFETAIAEGMSAYMAAEQIVAQYELMVHDPDCAPILFYALAELQLRHGVVSTKIRKRALTIINSGEGLERWHGESPDIFEARKNVEQDLRKRLVNFG